MNKRGLSGIVTTLIIIALSIVAGGIFWFVVNNVLEGSQVEDKSSDILDKINSLQGGYSAFTSCKDILDSGYTKEDGNYLIDLDGQGGEMSFEVYCDMTTDGGGWTLVEKDFGGSSFVPTLSQEDFNTSILLDDSWSDEEGKFSDEKMKFIWLAGERELLWRRSDGHYVKMKYTEDFINNYWSSNFGYSNRPSEVFQYYYRYSNKTWYAINGHSNNWHYSNYNDAMGDPPFSDDRMSRDQNDHLTYWATRSNGLMDDLDSRFHIYIR